MQSVILEPIQDKSISTVYISRCLAAICLFFSITFPTALQEIKYCLLLGIIFFMLIDFKNFALWRGTVFLSLYFAFIGLVGSAYGLIVANPGALHVMTVMVIYPILFSFFSILYKPGDINKILVILFWCACVIIVIHALYIFSAMGMDGGKSMLFLSQIYNGDDGIYIDGHFVKYTLPSVSSMVFLVPCIFFKIVLKKSQWFSLIIFSLLIALSILANRRGIFITSGLVFLLALSILIFYKRLFHIHFGLLIACAIIGSLILLMNDNYIFDRIISSLDFTYDRSNLERRYQWDALMKGFMESPLFGAGAGAVAEYVRSDTMPWAYELYYTSILFQYGLFGFISYAAGIVLLSCFMFKQVISYNLSRDSRTAVFCFFMGFIAFILATETNPYLAKFDYMWVIFIPVAMLNSYKLKGSI